MSSLIRRMKQEGKSVFDLRLQIFDFDKYK